MLLREINEWYLQLTIRISHHRGINVHPKGNLQGKQLNDHDTATPGDQVRGLLLFSGCICTWATVIKTQRAFSFQQVHVSLDECTQRNGSQISQRGDGLYRIIWRWQIHFVCSRVVS